MEPRPSSTRSLHDAGPCRGHPADSPSPHPLSHAPLLGLPIAVAEVPPTELRRYDECVYTEKLSAVVSNDMIQSPVERQQTTLRFDPFRELDRLTQPIWNARPSVPLEVFRKGENFVIRVDLPGIDPTSSDLTVNQDVLTDHRRAFLDASGRR